MRRMNGEIPVRYETAPCILHVFVVRVDALRRTLGVVGLVARWHFIAVVGILSCSGVSAAVLGAHRMTRARLVAKLVKSPEAFFYGGKTPLLSGVARYAGLLAFAFCYALSHNGEVSALLFALWKKKKIKSTAAAGRFAP
jgi:hypothetical protein